jgi:hypothetical protein
MKNVEPSNKKLFNINEITLSSEGHNIFRDANLFCD